MEQDQINSLIEKYIAGTASGAELEQLHHWYRSTAYSAAEYPDQEELVQKRMLDRLDREITPVRKTKILIRRVAVAASVLICLGMAFYFYNSRYKTSGTGIAQISNDIDPGGNKAILTLANGNKINLSGVKTGIVVNTLDLTYNDGSKVQVSPRTEDSNPGTMPGSGPSSQKEMTVSTPQGGTYQVILPDSTRVWLNAASSLKFPATFSGLESRKVELNGEAYFEVAKLTRKSKTSSETRIPFFVVSKGQEVEVLGTHFNINAYSDQTATKTSLLEGIIRIKNDNGNALLKPGQQAISMAKGIELVNGDAEDAIAWKNGYFMFDNEDLASVMTKLCRWYNVEVNYEDEAVKNVKYYGTISRFEKISKVLTKLETTGNLKFEVKGKTVHVSEK
jgi:transmembrane sensor